jgi:predicted AAA+ superfamily ATPase
MFPRSINILKNNSFFLFGARGTGKTSLLGSMLPADQVYRIDLLDRELEGRLLSQPQALTQLIKERAAGKRWVIIDEVQKAPALLDIVHAQIESGSHLFGLTGSSARKLRRGGANLLAGRAYVYNLFPLTTVELAESYALDTLLRWGSLPKTLAISGDDERRLFLESYADTYLREEVIAEQLVRNAPPFRFFLEIAAQMNGEQINLSAISRQLHIDPKTVRTYFEILEDTLLGFSIHPFSTSIRKQLATKAPRFYFFDIGVCGALQKTLSVPLRAHTSAYGKAFEHLVILELWRRNSYGRRDYTFSYLRTKDGAEIDIVVSRPGQPTALIEIKSSTQVERQKLGNLNKIARDMPNSEAFCFSLDPIPQEFDRVRCLHWEEGIRLLGL